MCLNKCLLTSLVNSPAGKTGSRIVSSHVTSGQKHQTSKNVSKILLRSDGVKTKTQSINHSPAQSSSVSGNRRVQLRPRKKGPRLSQDGGDESVQADESTSLSIENMQQPGANVNRALVRVSRTQSFSFRGRKCLKFCQKVPGVHKYSYTAEENHH